MCQCLYDAVGSDKLVGHFCVATGPVDEGQVEGNLPAQIHLVTRDTLEKDIYTQTETQTERGGGLRWGRSKR